jgi:hypothetical protein
MAFARLKLEHREEMVRNRYKRSYICITFVLASTLSLMAQSDRTGGQRWEDVQATGEPLLISAALVEAPAFGVGSESDLPDAPSSSRSDSSTADPAPSPVVKKESHGALPAATGGPLSPDRSVADRNYLLINGGMIGASIFNAEMTIHCLQKHPSCNDVPSSLKSRTALYGIGIPADLGIAYLSYLMKKKHSRIWYVPSAIVGGANLFLGVRAYRWSQDQ